MFAVLQGFIQGFERCGVEITTGDTVNGTPTHSAAKILDKLIQKNSCA
jgi:hypothetical protein